MVIEHYGDVEEDCNDWMMVFDVNYGGKALEDWFCDNGVPFVLYHANGGEYPHMGIAFDGEARMSVQSNNDERIVVVCDKDGFPEKGEIRGAIAFAKIANAVEAKILKEYADSPAWKAYCSSDKQWVIMSKEGLFWHNGTDPENDGFSGWGGRGTASLYDDVERWDKCDDRTQKTVLGMLAHDQPEWVSIFEKRYTEWEDPDS
jgi:hypothetical protein